MMDGETDHWDFMRQYSSPAAAAHQRVLHDSMYAEETLVHVDASYQGTIAHVGEPPEHTPSSLLDVMDPLRREETRLEETAWLYAHDTRLPPAARPPPR